MTPSWLCPAGLLAFALVTWPILVTAQRARVSVEGKTIEFAPGCTGSIRTLDASVVETTSSYRTYRVRYEFKHACDRAMMPYFRVQHRVQRSDGVVIDRRTEGPDETCPVIKPGDRSPLIITSRVDVHEGDGKQILGKPWVEHLGARFGGWRGSLSGGPRSRGSR